MRIERFYLNCLAHASYLVVDEGTSIAAVIDPQRDTDIYVDAARAKGWVIQYVLLTHFHADFVAGHLELRERVGAQIAIGARATAEFAAIQLDEERGIEFGDVRLTAWQTPGHTPDAISILAFDLNQSRQQPVAVFTGDTLFVGDVGRPDLLGSLGFEASELAGLLYDSIEKLKSLPDETVIYPAHGAGSLCGKSLGKEACSTIGQQKKLNYALQPMSKQAFVELVLADQPFAPKYFVHDAMMNRKEHSTLAQSMSSSLQPMSIEAVLASRSARAQIVDTRDPNRFAEGYLPDSINIGIDGSFATWAGSVLDPTRPIVIVAESGRETESIMRLGRIGFDRVLGYLDGGSSALAKVPGGLASYKRVSASELDCMTDPHWVLDVRAAHERATGAIEASVHIPLNELPDRVAEVPAGQKVVVHCAGGYRSAIAASILRRDGRNDVTDLIGGYKSWASRRTLPRHDSSDVAIETSSEYGGSVGRKS